MRCKRSGWAARGGRWRRNREAAGGLSSGHERQALGRLLDELEQQGPGLMRGDCCWGHEDSLNECQQRHRPNLFRLRRTANLEQRLRRLVKPED